MMALIDADAHPVAGRDGALAALPILILYPHSRCNCRCVMCDIWRNRDRQEIDPGEVRDWLSEIRRLGVERAVLSGGEALLNRGLPEMCRMLHGSGVRVTVLSSGLLLERNAKWMAACVDDVVVSLDGPEEVHDRIRGVAGAFRKLGAGVAALRRARLGFRVTGRCVVQRSNHAELRQTVRAAQEAGLDQISFLAADVSTDAFNRPGGWPDERAAAIALGECEVQSLEREIEQMEHELAHEFATGFIAESATRLHERILGHYRALLGDNRFSPKSCVAPWVSSVVEANGDVRPCFFHGVIGNVREAGSLEAVVNSPGAIAFRQGLDVRTDPICARCVCSLSSAGARRAT